MCKPNSQMHSQSWLFFLVVIGYIQFPVLYTWREPNKTSAMLAVIDHNTHLVKLMNFRKAVFLLPTVLMCVDREGFASFSSLCQSTKLKFD